MFLQKMIAGLMALAMAVATALLLLEPGIPMLPNQSADTGEGEKSLSRAQRRQTAARSLDQSLRNMLARINPGEGTANVAHGIDVSHHNSDKAGPIDWKKVASTGIDFAYIKASQGVTIKDTAFETNWKAAKAAGLDVGAYHFLSSLSEADAQAKEFLLTYKPRSDSDLVPALDVEWDFKPDTNIDRWEKFSATQIVKRMETWLELVHKDTKVKPIIYTNKIWWDRRIGSTGDTLRQSYDIWIADFSKNSEAADQPNSIPGFTTVLWQFGSIKMDGIHGIVDVNKRLD